jgi:hypothetical protein
MYVRVRVGCGRPRRARDTPAGPSRPGPALTRGASSTHTTRAADSLFNDCWWRGAEVTITEPMEAGHRERRVSRGGRGGWHGQTGNAGGHWLGARRGVLSRALDAGAGASHRAGQGLRNKLLVVTIATPESPERILPLDWTDWPVTSVLSAQQGKLCDLNRGSPEKLSCPGESAPVVVDFHKPGLLSAPTPGGRTAAKCESMG